MLMIAEHYEQDVIYCEEWIFLKHAKTCVQKNISAHLIMSLEYIRRTK